MISIKATSLWLLSYVCGVVVNIFLDQEWSGIERTRNSCPLLVERGNESRHLVFWSLETQTGLKV
jgi:hypothetical protein